MFIIFWQVAASVADNPAIPTFTDIMLELYSLVASGSIWPHVLASFRLVIKGTSLAVTFGFGLGIIMSRYKFAYRFCLSLLESFRAIPAITLFPVLIILLGLGIESRIAVVFWTAWPVVTLVTMSAITNVDSDIIESAAICGAGKWRTMMRIQIPLANQGILTGIRSAMGLGWVAVVVAEMLGASHGLGYFLLWSSQSFQFARVYATIIVIALIGGVMNISLMRIQKGFEI